MICVTFSVELAKVALDKVSNQVVDLTASRAKPVASIQDLQVGDLCSLIIIANDVVAEWLSSVVGYLLSLVSLLFRPRIRCQLSGHVLGVGATHAAVVGYDPISSSMDCK